MKIIIIVLCIILLGTTLWKFNVFKETKNFILNNVSKIVYKINSNKKTKAYLNSIINEYKEKIDSYESLIVNYEILKKEKKYKLSSLGKQARFRTYEDSFVWLNEAMIVNTCFNATDPHVGLALSADNATQKCYMADTGLLVTHTFQDKKYTDNELYRAILFDKLNINEGMLMENIVAQMLRHSRSRLYFYSRSDSQNRENHMEIDFLITEGKKIAPVEVKSGNYRSHSSLDKFRKHFSSVIGNSYILYTKDVMIKDGIIHLPLYMAELL